MLRVGYFTELVAPLDLPTKVDALAAKIAANPPAVVNNMKRHLNAIASGYFDAAAITRDHEASLGSEDLKEGLAAMKQKWDPKFTGR